MVLNKEIIELGKQYSFDRKTTANLLLEVDQLSPEELSDLEYVEDRLDAHSSWLT